MASSQWAGIEQYALDNLNYVQLEYRDEINMGNDINQNGFRRVYRLTARIRGERKMEFWDTYDSQANKKDAYGLYYKLEEEVLSL